jgi:hypothetical protein
MSPGGVILPELSDRVDELERQLAELRDAPQDTIGSTTTEFINAKGEVESVQQPGGMTWIGHWRSNEGYELENVVRYKAKSYVCIQPVPVFPRGLGPGVKKLQLGPADTVLPPLDLLTTGIGFGGALEITDQYWNSGGEGEVIGGNVKGQCWQINAESAAAKLTIPPPALGLGLLCFMEVYCSQLDAKGRNLPLATGNFKEFKELKLEKLTPHYVIVWGGETEKIIGGKIVRVNELPLAYELAVSGGEFTGLAGNPPPPNDPTHWALLAGA